MFPRFVAESKKRKTFLPSSLNLAESNFGAATELTLTTLTFVEIGTNSLLLSPDSSNVTMMELVIVDDADGRTTKLPMVDPLGAKFCCSGEITIPSISKVPFIEYTFGTIVMFFDG